MEVDSKNQRTKIKIIAKRKRSKDMFRELNIQTRGLSETLPTGTTWKYFVDWWAQVSKLKVTRHPAEQWVLRWPYYCEAPWDSMQAPHQKILDISRRSFRERVKQQNDHDFQQEQEQDTLKDQDTDFWGTMIDRSQSKSSWFIYQVIRFEYTFFLFLFLF